MRVLRLLAGVGALALVLAFGGCAQGRFSGMLPANQRPTVEITQSPTVASQAYFYAYELRWAGFDADGVVDHYLYCVDPPSAAGVDTPWVTTTANRQTFAFHSDHIDSAGTVTATSYHTFVLKAVDNGGLASAPVTRSFTSFTIAPTIQIVNPILNHLFTPTFGPEFRVTWTGTDPDGQKSHKPVKYKYRVFTDDNLTFDFLTLLIQPDSLRRKYAPNFAGWDSVGGDTTSAEIRDLFPSQRYVLAIVAFDEAGAYSPVFSYDTNLMYFYVDYAGRIGPTMTLFNESFFYQATGGSFSLDPTTFAHADLAADQPLKFSWFGKTPSGGFITGYRWRVDGDVTDETPRSDEEKDILHWSQWSFGNTSTVLPPFSPVPPQNQETHFLYVEGRDNTSAISLAAVQFNVLRPAFDRDLLIFKDSRFLPDRKGSDGKLVRPSGLWPTATELDTFFFAAGGKPWQAYPTGTVSPVGVFAGYSYDTLGGRAQPSGLISLSQLGHYKHLLWYADYKAAISQNPPDYPGSPTTTLHQMSYPLYSNPLATWVKQGGKLWLFGGGAATSLQGPWETSGTNGAVFSNADGELVPGRFMYDIIHWRSEITATSTSQGHKNDALTSNWAGAPDYSSLPEILFEREPDTDPITLYGPNRTSPSDYYQTSTNAEILSKANDIVEVLQDGSGVTTSVLDTLYFASGGQAGSKPIMTLYHGSENTPVVFSGFPLWYFSRDNEIQIVDFVLQTLWGLPRSPVARDAQSAHASRSHLPPPR